MNTPAPNNASGKYDKVNRGTVASQAGTMLTELNYVSTQLGRDVTDNKPSSQEYNLNSL